MCMHKQRLYMYTPVCFEGGECLLSGVREPLDQASYACNQQTRKVLGYKSTVTHIPYSLLYLWVRVMQNIRQKSKIRK